MAAREERQHDQHDHLVQRPTSPIVRAPVATRLAALLLAIMFNLNIQVIVKMCHEEPLMEPLK
jgi:hypothetical protein